MERTTHEALDTNRCEGSLDDVEPRALTHREQYLRDVAERRAAKKAQKARHVLATRGPQKPAGLSPKVAKNLVLVIELTMSEGRFEGRRVWPDADAVAVLADLDAQRASFLAGRS